MTSHSIIIVGLRPLFHILASIIIRNSMFCLFNYVKLILINLIIDCICDARCSWFWHGWFNFWHIQSFALCGFRFAQHPLQIVRIQREPSRAYCVFNVLIFLINLIIIQSFILHALCCICTCTHMKLFKSG